VLKKREKVNMSDELKLPEVGELSFPQWQNWLVRYNRVLAERDHRIEKDAQHIAEMYGLVAAMNADHTANKNRIEKLEAALREIAAPDWDSESYPDEIARKALEGKDD